MHVAVSLHCVQPRSEKLQETQVLNELLGSRVKPAMQLVQTDVEEQAVQLLNVLVHTTQFPEFST